MSSSPSLHSSAGGAAVRPLVTKVSNLAKSSSPRSLLGAHAIQAQFFASQVDAMWFSSLPPKIRQCQFSLDEQALLSRDYDRMMIDAADETLIRLKHCPDTSQTPPGIKVGPSKGSLTHSLRRKTVDASTQPSTSSAIAPDNLCSWSTTKRLGEQEDDDSQFEDAFFTARPGPHPETRHTFRPLSAEASHSSYFGRTLALGTPRSRRPSLPTRPVYSGPAVLKDQSLSGHGASYRKNACASTNDNPAQYYRDPDARRKLRVYLASPQKFDEAVEFGFPSLGTSPRSPLATSMTSLPSAGPIEQTFLHSDGPSSSKEKSHPEYHDNTSDDDTAEGSVSSASDTLHTPREKELPLRGGVGEGFKMDSSCVRPYVVSTRADSGKIDPSTGREMTLHMTLTRPDLRTTVSESTIAQDSACEEPLRPYHIPTLGQSHLDAFQALDDHAKTSRLWRKLISR